MLSATASSIATTFLLPKSLNTAGFYFVVNGLINSLDIYMEDSDSIITKLLNALQLPNNDHLIIQFVI